MRSETTKKLPHFLGTDWPSKSESCVIEAENSRGVPGKEQVSVWYGVSSVKFALKQDTLENFKTLHQMQL